MAPQQAVFPVGFLWPVLLLVWRLFKTWSPGSSERAVADHRGSSSPAPGLTMRLRLEHLTGEREFDIFRIEVQGVIPTHGSGELRFTSSCLDVTDVGQDGYRGREPVLSLAEQLQEPDTYCYQDHADLGRVGAGSRIKEWATVGNLIPEALVTPVSGRRKLAVFLNLSRESKPLRIQRGFVVEGEPLLTLSREFEWDVQHEGYKTRFDRGRRAEAAALRVALAVACSDGPICPEETRAIEAWKERLLSADDAEGRAAHSAELERVGTEALAQAANGGLSIGSSLQQLKHEHETRMNLETLALCLDITVANGRAEPDVLRSVRRAAMELEIGADEYRAMEEHRLVALIDRAEGTQELRLLLGIDPEWPPEVARQHLTDLYTRWNARVESAKDDEQRRRAEGMLERIAQARQEVVDRL